MKERQDEFTMQSEEVVSAFLDNMKALQEQADLLASLSSELNQ